MSEIRLERNIRPSRRSLRNTDSQVVMDVSRDGPGIGRAPETQTTGWN